MSRTEDKTITSEASGANLPEPDFFGAGFRAEQSLTLIERTVERLEAGIEAVYAIEAAGRADGMMQQANALGWVAEGLYDETVKMTEYVSDFRGHFERAMPEARTLPQDKEILPDLESDMGEWVTKLFAMGREYPDLKKRLGDLGMEVIGRKEQINGIRARLNRRPDVPPPEAEAGEGGEL